MNLAPLRSAIGVMGWHPMGKLEHSSLRSQLIGVMGYWNNAGMGRRPSDKKREAGKLGEQLFT